MRRGKREKVGGGKDKWSEVNADAASPPPHFPKGEMRGWEREKQTENLAFFISLFFLLLMQFGGRMSN